MNNPLTRLLRRGKKTDQEADGAPGQEPEQSSEPAITDENGLRNRFGSWLGRPMTSFHLLIAVAALPTSIWPQAMSNGRPSRAVDFVRPQTACLVAV